jgi:DNA-binding transcriptional ArsR family regulator
MKPLSNVTDPRIVKALAHPLRVRILGALERRTASPTELAGELDAPLGNVSYHVRQLARLGLVKLVSETPRRGAVEHHYRLDVRPSVSDHAWSEAPTIVKQALVGSALGQIGEQVSEAAERGGFERADAHVSRLPLTLDAQGFAEAAAILAEVVDRLKQVEDASLSRLERADHEGQTPALAVLMLAEAGAPGTPDPPPVENA